MQRTCVRAKPHDLEELDQPKLFEATTQDTAGRHKRILIRREPDVLDTSPTRMPPRNIRVLSHSAAEKDIGNAPRRALLGKASVCRWAFQPRNYTLACRASQGADTPHVRFSHGD